MSLNVRLQEISGKIGTNQEKSGQIWTNQEIFFKIK